MSKVSDRLIDLSIVPQIGLQNLGFIVMRIYGGKGGREGRGGGGGGGDCVLKRSFDAG